MPSDDPIAIFSSLFERASRDCAEPDAMVLSTVDPDGRPSARYVLLKGVDDRGFVFYTNVESRKAQGPRCASVCRADVLLAAGNAGAHRGTPSSGCLTPTRMPTSRRGPAGSQIGAWASLQSAGLASRGGAGRPRSRGRGSLQGRRSLAAAVLDRLPRRAAVDRVLDARSGAVARAGGLSARFRGMDPLAPVSLVPKP